MQVISFKLPVTILRYFLQLQLSSLILQQTTVTWGCVMSDIFVYPFIRLAPVFSLTSSPLISTCTSLRFQKASPHFPVLNLFFSPRLSASFSSAWTPNFYQSFVFLVLSLGVFVFVVYQSITGPPFALSG